MCIRDRVVVGGGNVAMDCTRSALRLGASKVGIAYRRRQNDMTALPEEVEGAIAEGAELYSLKAPVRVEADEKMCIRDSHISACIISLSKYQLPSHKNVCLQYAKRLYYKQFYNTAN